MEIVKIQGGLGNQMFEYAFLLGLRAKGRIFRFMDISPVSQETVHNGFELNRVFAIKATFIEHIIKWNFKHNNALTRVINAILITRVTEKADYVYQQDVADINSKMVRHYDGYWQNQHYFISIEPWIREIFKFDTTKMSDKTLELSKILTLSKNSVSLHVRRGDYCTEFNTSIYGNICTLDYYHKAINMIVESIPDARFHVFSDDMEWVYQQLILPENTVYIDWNKGRDSWQDMALMSLCKHHIIANSSFSWWGHGLHNHLKVKLLYLHESF